MARKTWESIGGVALEIIQGQHDADLDYIAQACKARLKNRFRAGSRVRLVNTRNVELDGKVGTVLKVNQKTVVVRVGEATDPKWNRIVSGREMESMDLDTLGQYLDATEGIREFNVPPHMLEAVA